MKKKKAVTSFIGQKSKLTTSGKSFIFTKPAAKLSLSIKSVARRVAAKSLAWCCRRKEPLNRAKIPPPCSSASSRAEVS